MADELHKAMHYASDLYRNREDEYYKMIIAGFEKAETFTWEKNAKEYFCST